MKNIENLRQRKVHVTVKGIEIEYDEYYRVNDNGEEIFDRELEIYNDERLYDIYKKRNNLLTASEIKDIRKKYQLTQKEYAQALGVGEVTIHRFEKGAIQTESVDSIIRLSSEPNNMYFLLMQNRKNLPDNIYTRTLSIVKNMIKLKEHARIDISKFDNLNIAFKTQTAKVVAANIINSYNKSINDFAQKFDIYPEYITNLKLQKLLYYVQAFSLLLFSQKAFDAKIFAWPYGPVVEEIYKEYKSGRADYIPSIENCVKVPDAIQLLIDEVILNYGGMEANKLISFTHEEEPWKNTALNSEITDECIKKYFCKVYGL